MDNLTGIAAFVCAAEQSSYVAAGRVLGLSSSAVAKSVGRLEARLGVRLLNRTTRHIGMTEAGRVFYERCRAILDDLYDAEATVVQARDAPRGRLRVSVPHIVGQHLLMPMLPAFCAAYPDIALDIDLEDRVVDIITEGLDIAIRSGEMPDSRLVARAIGPQNFVVCGSPGYLRKHGTPKTPEDLASHHCIHFKYPTSGRLAPWAFQPPCTPQCVPSSLVFNNTDAGLRAAVDGLGLAHLPTYVARPAIVAGSLQSILSGFMQPFGALACVWPSSRLLSPKVRAFVDFVLPRMQKQIGPD